MAKCKSVRLFVAAYLKAIMNAILFVGCFLLWPVAVIFIKYHSDAKYYLSKGLQRAQREKKHEQSEMLWSTARVMEVRRCCQAIIGVTS